MNRLYPRGENAEFAKEAVYSVPELNLPSGGGGAGAAKRPYIYYNMVSSVDGKIVTENANALGLGSETDYYFLGKLRVAADAVMCGANTFRRDEFVPSIRPLFQAERAQYFPATPHPLGVIISSDGELPPNKKFWRGGKAIRVVLLGEKAAKEREKQWQEFAQVYRIPNDANGKPDAVAAVNLLYTELGVKRLLVEGGPLLNYSLMTQGYADELFWTLAPKIVAGEQTMVSGATIPNSAIIKLELVSSYQNENELFMRYKFVP
jgi:2,5-diamino-6-(ribosylamino)-4(3H)-pyrimidinone 5'-phosphate reductase